MAAVNIWNISLSERNISLRDYLFNIVAVVASFLAMLVQIINKKNNWVGLIRLSKCMIHAEISEIQCYLYSNTAAINTVGTATLPTIRFYFQGTTILI